MSLEKCEGAESDKKDDEKERLEGVSDSHPEELSMFHINMRHSQMYLAAEILT